jgi:outer membrane protein
MRVSRNVGARAWLAALLIPALSVSAFGQAAPTAAQQPTPTTPISDEGVLLPTQTPPPAPQPPVVQPPPTPTGPPVQTTGPQPPVQAPTTDAPPIQEQRTSGPTLQLSIDEAVKRGLEFNLDVQVTRLQPRLSDLQVQAAQSAWVPMLTNNTQYTDNTRTNPDTIYTNASGISEKTTFTNSGIQQYLPWYGTSYSVGWANQRFETSAARQLFNPALSSNMTFSVTQPLLRDFKVDIDRNQLLVTRKQREISDVQLHQQIVVTTRQVRNAYWDLVYARANLDVAQQSLDVARQTLRDNRTRVEVGTMAPIDIVQAEAEVARNEENTIIAAAQIDQAEDDLRRLMFDPASPDYWTTNIDLTETPQLPTSAADVDVEAAVANALQKRTDVSQLRKQLEVTNFNTRYYKNQLLPVVNAYTTYGLSALGGTAVPFTNDQGVPVVPPAVSWGSVYSSLFGRDYPRWVLGVNVQYPIGRSNQEVLYARSKLQYQQGELNLKDQELQAAAEVRNAGRTVNTNRRRVAAARSSRIFSERQLDAQRKKFAVGLSTPFEVVQAQRDLAQAKDSELKAIIDYVESLVNFEASQEAPLTGSGSTGTTNQNQNQNQNGNGTNGTGNNGGSGTTSGTGSSGQNR